jgi:hypothetical protein
MPTPQITALPTAPARSMVAATFITTMDAWIAALAGFVPQANAVVTQCDADVVSTGASAATALSSQITASAAAASALGAPATNASSTTSLTVATGAQSLTIQTGKSFSVGQVCVLARTSDPVNTQMVGIVLSYNSGTGALVLTISSKVGAGTYTDWTFSLNGAGLIPALGATGSTQSSPAANSTTTLTSGSNGVQALNPQGHNAKLVLPDATTLQAGQRPYFLSNENQTYAYGVYDGGLNFLFSVAPREEIEIALADNSTVNGKWRPLGPQINGTMVVAEAAPFSNGASNMTDAIGTPSTLAASGTGWATLSASLSVHLVSAGTNLYAVGVDISTSPPSIGTATLISASVFGQNNTAIPQIIAIDATHALVVFPGGSTTISGVVLTLASTAVTVGSVVASAAALGTLTSGLVVVAVSTTSYIIYAAYGTGAELIGMNVTGVTVTMGAWTSVFTTSPNSSGPTGIAYSATTAVFGHPNTTQTQVVAASISGTTLTVGAVLAVGPVAAGSGVLLFPIAATAFIAYVMAATGGATYMGVLSLTTVTLTTTVASALLSSFGGMPATMNNGAGGTTGSFYADLYSASSIVLFYESSATSGHTFVIVVSVNTGTGLLTVTKGTTLGATMCPTASIDKFGRNIRRIGSGSYMGYSFSNALPTVTKGNNYLTFVTWDGTNFAVTKRIVPGVSSAREAAQYGSPISTGWMSAYGETYVVSNRMAFDPADQFNIVQTTRPPAILSTKYALLLGQSARGTDGSGLLNMTAQIVEYANAA